MNWPDNLEDIECVGFPSKMLEILIKAWDNHSVEVLVGVIRRTSTDLSWEFDYGHFRYRIDCEQGSEMREGRRYWSVHTPYRIERTAKLGYDINGQWCEMEVYPIVEPLQVKPTHQPAYQGVWSSF